ncbi:MAG TPA: hypothetical protein VF799_01225 [Geobacteraceae bacterium]
MDKIDLFRELERLAAGNDLDAVEIRLYLLFLANCRKSRKGQIEFATIKNAIGDQFSRDKLQKALQRLFASNLAAVTSVFPDDTSEKNFVVSYLILPTREL